MAPGPHNEEQCFRRTWDTLVTPDGYLFDKEAILECMVQQKGEISRQTKAYEKQKKKASKLKELAKAKQESKIKSFWKERTPLFPSP